MKKMLFVIGLLFTHFAINAQSNNFQKLIGKWIISSEDGTPAYLEILDSANILLTYQGETRKCNDAKIHFDKSPYWFDFTTGTGDSAITVKTLMEVFDNGVAKWQLFVDEDRSPYFTATKGEILYLKRSKSNVLTASNTR